MAAVQPLVDFWNRQGSSSTTYGTQQDPATDQPLLSAGSSNGERWGPCGWGFKMTRGLALLGAASVCAGILCLVLFSPSSNPFVVEPVAMPFKTVARDSPAPSKRWGKDAKAPYPTGAWW
eukprot:CAMPEP_0172641174 /NCGR_PEP_ID=MMETSP1068-20121228/226100_1 /TAXON_ID=35684 /ORGANISM="Pseudopedinella elastica, Strain CCMP716" /LENGTH=119 /DNA_ID=CAMNT_0013454693 /DNA_START=81 /DNA_END=437 /DNA_ORIENTATION=-